MALRYQKANLTLATRIRETAYTAFGTRYVEAQAVRRQACRQLDEWLSRALAAQGPGLPPIAVVTGERYDGKTWLVYQWLVEIAERTPVPIFLVGSGRGVQSDRRLTELQIEDLEPALRRERRYAESFLHSYRSEETRKAPWAVVILDGINEYAPNHEAWLRHLDTALGRGETDCRPTAVLLTVRARAWPELRQYLSPEEAPINVEGSARRPAVPTIVEIPLGPFGEDEISAALARLQLPADFLEGLPEGARVLAHRPRYLSLIAQHRRKLGDYAAITPEVLHWLDLCDKMRTRQGRDDWGPGQYQAFLRDVAKYWLDQKFLDEVSVRALLGGMTSQVSGVLAELSSEGVLSGASGSFTVQPDRLAMGYGLFLRDSLLQASAQEKDLREVLHDLLAPLSEGDEAVEALRAASTLMLVQLASQSAAGISPEWIDVSDALLGEWLDSRNLAHRDLEAINELRRLLFDSLFRAWREVWRKTSRQRRMREIAVMVFGEMVESDGEARERLRHAVKEWFRLVPLEGGWFQRSRTEAELKTQGEDESAAAGTVAALIRSRVALPSLRHLGLQTVEGLDISSLQTMGLYLVSRARELVDLEDLLALTAVRVLLEEPIGAGDLWVIRRAAENVPLQCFERELSRCAGEKNGILRQALRTLIEMADRADLAGVKARLRREMDPAERQARSRSWPTKQNYRTLLQRALGSPVEMARFLMRLGDLPCNPTLPELSGGQKRDLARALRKGLVERRVAGRLDSLHDLKSLLPAMAAWDPALGVEVVRQFVHGLPSRIRKGERASLMELRGHTALARGRTREDLREALVHSHRRGDDWSIAQRELTLALLPAATLEETVTLLATKGNAVEHSETFELAGTLRTAADRRTLVEILKAIRSPGRKRQLRFLLAEAGGTPLPAPEVKALCRTLARGGERDIAAALDLAAESRVAGIDPSLLFPISRGEIAAGTFAPHDASRLLVRLYDHETIKNHLDDYWRAKSAARRPEDAKTYLDEISADLADYKERRLGMVNRWERYDLPSELASHLDRERVADWTQAFTSWDGGGWRFWGGLVRPTFEWCLRNDAAEQARSLWSQVYPFQRQRFGGGSRLTIDGVDWVLHELNRPTSDDELARSFLTELILDARSDLELFEIALGARFRGTDRLRAVAQDLSTAQQAESRARAAAILGWLSEGQNQLQMLRRNDPSTWVREQATTALQRHALESWSRIWFERFLTSKAPVDRWAAGRLFIACTDRRIDVWAWKQVREGVAQRRLKGETILLLWAAQERAKQESDKLKTTLLAHAVDEISTVVHPWRRDDEWILSRYGRRD